MEVWPKKTPWNIQYLVGWTRNNGKADHTRHAERVHSWVMLVELCSLNCSNTQQYSGTYHLSGSSCLIPLCWKESYVQGLPGRDLDQSLSAGQKIGTSAITWQQKIQAQLTTPECQWQNTGPPLNAQFNTSLQRILQNHKCCRNPSFLIKSNLSLDVALTYNNVNNMMGKSRILLLLYLKIFNIDMG